MCHGGTRMQNSTADTVLEDGRNLHCKLQCKKQKQKTATKARQSKMSFLRAAHVPHVSMVYKYPAREKVFLPVYCHNNGMWHLLVV